MSDSTTYINTFLDHSMSMIHENVSQILQLRTQAKLATDLVKQKDEVIAGLQQELDNCKSESADWHKNADSYGSELTKKKDEFKRLEDECNALRGKVSHMESLASQLTNSNQEISKRNEEVKQLNDRVNGLITENDKIKNEFNQTKVQLGQKDQEIVSKNSEIESLSSKLEALEKKLEESLSPKKQINTKGKSAVPKVSKDEPKTEENDDF